MMKDYGEIKKNAPSDMGGFLFQIRIKDDLSDSQEELTATMRDMGVQYEGSRLPRGDDTDEVRGVVKGRYATLKEVQERLAELGWVKNIDL